MADAIIIFICNSLHPLLHRTFSLESLSDERAFSEEFAHLLEGVFVTQSSRRKSARRTLPSPSWAVWQSSLGEVKGFGLFGSVGK